jgi:hypothetical protein
MNERPEIGDDGSAALSLAFDPVTFRLQPRAHRDRAPASRSHSLL